MCTYITYSVSWSFRTVYRDFKVYNKEIHHFYNLRVFFAPLKGYFFIHYVKISFYYSFEICSNYIHTL